MDMVARLEQALSAAVSRAEPGPPGLAAAMHHAVFPRGARIRPRLCMAVAKSCEEGENPLALAAAAAIELLHCASLVHDDLPCFDNADSRRGRPSVHRAFGEPLAVLCGDALIVLAFQIVADAAAQHPARLAGLISVIAASVGAPDGICAGQAWESEAEIDLSRYQRAKTGALFAAATMAGAAAAGLPGAPWRTLGERLGEAYQVADDLRDVFCEAEEMGKPAGQDAAHRRPNAVAQFGVDGAVSLLAGLAEAAIESIPACPGSADLRALIRLESQRLLPRSLAARAA
jgi:geranylgeranyl diphosphate synthase type II